MKLSVVQSKKHVIPEVGQLFKCAAASDVYLRISDEDGAKVYPNRYLEHTFFCVSPVYGNVCWALRDASYIILEPVGGELKVKLV